MVITTNAGSSQTDAAQALSLNASKMEGIKSRLSAARRREKSIMATIVAAFIGLPVALYFVSNIMTTHVKDAIDEDASLILTQIETTSPDLHQKMKPLLDCARAIEAEKIGPFGSFISNPVARKDSLIVSTLQCAKTSGAAMVIVARDVFFNKTTP